MTAPAEPDLPSRWGALVFRAKVTGHQVLRGLRNRRAPVRRYGPGSALVEARLLGESSSRLWSEGRAAEWRLQAGKVQNLRVARRAFDGVEVPAGAVLGFWAQLGRPTRDKGYVEGRELREGCLIPSVAGGICQLSNALYDAALKAGLEIVERHAHTQVIPGSLAEDDRDATVFWNHVDLRLRAPFGFRVEVELTDEILAVRIRGDRRQAPRWVDPGPARPRVAGAPEGCDTCGVADCFRSLEPRSAEGRRAFLVDEVWPEFDRFLQAERKPGDELLLPLDGARWGRPGYAWTTAGLRARSFPWETLRRAWGSRRLAAQGAARQRFLLEARSRLAAAMGRALAYDQVHLVVSLDLLPFLWREGHLAGRSFDVLLTRWPLALLQARLHAAAAAHPESRTLRDFRADPALLEAESQALVRARRLVTPHAALAAELGARAHRIPWALESIPPRSGGDIRLFPASTLGRKGAYEVREAVRALGGRWIAAGPVLEDPAFWAGLPVEPRPWSEVPWEQVGAVVQPAWVESRPHRLLEALARGVPVVATPACGLGALPGVTEVASGDVRGLVAALS